MSREQFLLDRKKGIGGSDVASIMGISPWRTALDVYNDKTSPDVNDEMNDDCKRGILAEEFVLKAYSEQTGETLQTDIPTFVDKEYPFMRGNVDAKVVGQNVIVEAKTTKASIKSWDAGVPEYYKIQVAYYAMLSGADRVDIAVWFSQFEYGCYTYWSDAAYEAKIKKTVVNFWQNHIVKGIPPKPQSLEELRVAHPIIDEDIIIKADKDIRQAVSELQEVSAHRKELETTEKDLKKTIQQYMGGAGLLDAGFCKLALKNRCTKRLDTSALKVANPEVYQNYLQETNYRILQFIGG